jgi:predicted ATPase
VDPVLHRVDEHRDAGAGLDAAAAALDVTPEGRVAIATTGRPDQPDRAAHALLRLARPGEIVVSQDVQSALVAGGRDPRAFVPAGWANLGEGLSTAAYLYRRIGTGGLGPVGERWVGPVRRGYLPAYRNAFLGRTGELIQVDEALRTSRAVTIVGPGGIGKTRLAVEHAAAVADRFEDGTWLVDLAGLEQPEAAWHKITETLAVAVARPSAATIADAIAGRDMLVVLDNCEHVAWPIGSLVDALADRHAGVATLATSRTRLSHRGERVVALTPLAWRGSCGAPAVELAVARASELGIAIGDGPGVGSGQTDLLAGLCATVSGMPLAIELAVAQLGHLSLVQLLSRMDDQLSMLSADTSSRHGSIRAVFESSLDLLSGAGREVLLASSVFRGTFDVADIGALVAMDPLDAEHVLVRAVRELVAASLYVASAGTGTTKLYHLLEPIRQFAYSRLVSSGRADAVEARHAEHLVTVATDHRVGRRRIEDLDGMIADLTSAHDWSRSHGRNDLAARIATTMLSLPSTVRSEPDREISDPTSRGEWT